MYIYIYFYKCTSIWICMHTHTHTHTHIFTYTLTHRWDRIAERIPNRSRKDVITRVKDLKKMLSAVSSWHQREGGGGPDLKSRLKNTQFRFLSRGACQHNRDSAGRRGGLCFIINANYICAGRKQQSCVLWRMRMCVHMCIHMCVRLIHTCDSSHSLWVECIHSMNV